MMERVKKITELKRELDLWILNKLLILLHINFKITPLLQNIILNERTVKLPYIILALKNINCKKSSKL
jgi:hypothetical protein